MNVYLRMEKRYYSQRVTKFVSDPLNGCETDNFSTLSSIFVNYDYNGKEFLMDDVRFWSEIESDKKEK